MMRGFLVDTSVWIDFFRQRKTPAVEKLYQLLPDPDVLGMTELIYQEVLQGALHEQNFKALEDYLSELRFFYPKQAVVSNREAARLYFTCRRKGITIRSTVDCLIAQIAIEHDLILFHDDKDFIHMATVVPKLKLYPA